ncbi:MAG: DNA polymerase III subunit alpha [Bdellovibrionales bacterium]|nr:DNA polymerase III subunit alpha [Bdellovibrionales bacterium]
MSFVHLHVHSESSLLESSTRINNLVKKAKEFNMPAVALTDLGNMFSCVDFYTKAKAEGVKPIIGLEVYVAPGKHTLKQRNEDGIPSRRIVLLAKDYKAYQNLCRLSSASYKDGFYYTPRVDKDLLKTYSKGLIALSGSNMGYIPWTFQRFGKEQTLKEIKFFKSIYKDNFYLEISRLGLFSDDEQKALEDFLITTSKKENIPLVASNESYYLEQKDAIIQDTLVCIAKNQSLNDPNRHKLPNQNFYFKSSEEMTEIFKDIPEALSNSLKIAELCNFEFSLKDKDGKPIYHLPSFKTKNNRALDKELKDLSTKGFKKLLSLRKKEFQKNFYEPRKKEYEDRLKLELKIINDMGFNGYFLIVQDFIRWAKEQGIPVGPGRGSGAGSLVAYSCGITDVDPIEHILIFERFLNPERISMPDFDIDFCQEHRSKVIEYVTQHYGEQSVSQIITFGKLQARAAIRDVGRVLGLEYSEVDVIAKLIPDKLGISLPEAIKEEPKIQEAMEADGRIKHLLTLAQECEGLTRHASIHAAGVIIADGEISSKAPLYRGVEDENVIQYEMKSAEKIGLIKFDFLGLKTLTHIRRTTDLIKLNKNIEIKAQEIDIHDPKIYELLSSGKTDGVFQFSSSVMTDFLIKLQPFCFDDLALTTSINRPGPMEMVPEYLKRRRGESKVKYEFNDLEEILKPSLGISIYQEQVMQIASLIASYSMGEADMLRRAMGKKIESEMLVQKDRFLSGAIKNKYDAKKAEKLFDSLAEFAKYGFNKSHAVVYSVISAQTAFLKAYYPVEFYAALLSTEMSDTDKVSITTGHIKRENIKIDLPHINTSCWEFTVKEDTIIYALGALKGVGQAAVESIVEARNKKENKKFKDLEDFFGSVDLRKVNKKTIESLISAGALNNFGFNKASLFKNFSKFTERASFKQEEEEIGQFSLFSLDAEEKKKDKIILPLEKDWSKSKMLLQEKVAFGFYLSDSPISSVQDISLKLFGQSLQDLVSRSKADGAGVGVGSGAVDVAGSAAGAGSAAVDVAGSAAGANKEDYFDKNLDGKAFKSFVLLSSCRELITKKGTKMAFAKVEDSFSSTELIVFPNAYKEVFESLVVDQVMYLEAKIQVKDGAPKLIAEKIKTLDEFLRSIKTVYLDLDKDSLPEGVLISDAIGKLKTYFADNSSKENSLIPVENNTAKCNFKIRMIVKVDGQRLLVDTEENFALKLDKDFIDMIASNFKTVQGLSFVF